MRKIIFHLSAGFAGTDSTEAHLYKESDSDEQISEDAWLAALQHAESYGYYPEEDLENYSEAEIAEMAQSGEIDNYTHNIEGYWEDYDPEKHDDLQPGGGKWKWA